MINKLKIFCHNFYKHKQRIILICGVFIFLFNTLPLNAQAESAVTIQNLSFGTFYTGITGGTVIIPSVGSRQATGSVILFSIDPGNPAIIRVNIKQDNNVEITTGNIVNLTNGLGGSMTLQVNDIFPLSPFTTGHVGTLDYDFYIGGTLTVGSSATTPSGNYSGSFDVIFNKP